MFARTRVGKKKTAKNEMKKVVDDNIIYNMVVVPV